MNSGLAMPPPEPAKSGQQGVPSARVPPKPNGDTGSMKVSDAAGCASA